jgi:hypothetical protein
MTKKNTIGLPAFTTLARPITGLFVARAVAVRAGVAATD